MVLGGELPGRVGRRRNIFVSKARHVQQCAGGPFCVLHALPLRWANHGKFLATSSRPKTERETDWPQACSTAWVGA